MGKTHFKKLMNPNYLGAFSLDDGKDIILTIASVRNEDVVGTDGKKEECMVCRFKENVLPMILNATNAKQVAKVVGSPYIEDWCGKQIQIGVEKVRAFGDVVEALRVRKIAPKPRQASNAEQNPELKCSSCGKPIEAAFGMDAEQLAKYTASKFNGECLCAACAKARSEGQK